MWVSVIIVIIIVNNNLGRNSISPVTIKLVKPVPVIAQASAVAAHTRIDAANIHKRNLNSAPRLITK